MRGKVLVFGLLAALALTGCATTKPVWFIATPGYVEAQIASSESATRAEYEARLAEIEQDLAAQRQVADELASMSDLISEIERNNRELLGLADQVEERLAQLPRETIEELVNVLTQYLESQ